MPNSHEESLKLVGDPAVTALLRLILERQLELEKMIMGAFPGGDFDGHRRYHEEMILVMQDRRKLRQAVLEQVIKGSVWALGIALVTAGWQYAKEHLRMP